MELFLNKFRERLLEVRLLTSEKKYSSCSTLSTYLTSISHFMGDSTCVCISEFFEWLFTNIRDEQNRYDVPDEKFDVINKYVEELIDFIVIHLPIESDNSVELFDLFKKTRYEVTDLQLWTTVNLQSRRRRPREVIFDEQ